MPSTFASQTIHWDIHIIGAGVVGSAIAANHLAEGLGITLIDQDSNHLRRRSNALCSDFGAHAKAMQNVKSGGFAVRIDAENQISLGRNAQTIVIESIVEQRDPKQELFRNAAKEFSSDTILSSNTSTLPLDQLFDPTIDRSRCCGLHFFMPVTNRPLVEIVRLPETRANILKIAESYAARIGKRVLIVDDRPGFVVNRMLVPYLNESVHLLCSGAAADQLGGVATRVGMPMSPLRLMDWIGMSTNFHAGRAFWQAYPKRIEPCALIPAMVKRGFEGRASGCGFFDYRNEESTDSLSASALELAKSYTRNSQEWTSEEIEARLFVPMLLEAACILNERTVEDTEQIDAAMRGGLGFHGPHGSIIDHFDKIGPQRTLSMIQRLKSVGRRYDPLPEFENQLGKAETVRAALQILSAL